jgi:excisionase family DNA binding protein
MNDDLTIEEAADFLNVSRSYLLDLLKSGASPVRLVGSERCVRMEDIVRYKEHIDAQRFKIRGALDVPPSSFDGRPEAP